MVLFYQWICLFWHKQLIHSFICRKPGVPATMLNSEDKKEPKDRKGGVFYILLCFWLAPLSSLINIKRGFFFSFPLLTPLLSPQILTKIRSMPSTSQSQQRLAEQCTQVHLSHLSRSGGSSAAPASRDPAQWPRSSGIWSGHFAEATLHQRPISFCSDGQEREQKKWNASSPWSPYPVRWPFCFYFPSSILGTVNPEIVWVSPTSVLNS